MTSRIRFVRLVLALAAPLVGAAPAAAGTLTVTYEVKSGTLQCCPGPGSVDAVGGRFTWRLPAAGLHTLASGSATLASFEAVGATTNALGASGLNVGAQLVGERTPSYVYASGVFYDFYAGPVSLRGGRSFSLAPTAYMEHYFRARGLGGSTADLAWRVCCEAFTPYGTAFTMTLSVTGREVSRTFSVPEPHARALWVLASSVAALAAAARWRRR